MNLQTFKADSMVEALLLVKRSMGADAVILHTRTYHRRNWIGLRRREVVEITAGQGVNVPPRRRPAAAAVRVARDLKESRRQFLQTPAAGNAMMLGLTQEMTSLKTVVQDLVTQTRRQRAPDVPEELFEHYLILTRNQVTEQLAADIIRSLHRLVRPEHLPQQQLVTDRLIEELEKLLPTAGPIRRARSTGPHVVALIGPTGVGKTTTIAKLAADLKLRQNHRVGLITLDTYRIAAIDQLKRYAEILRSPLSVTSTREDMREAIASMCDCDFVLIDTAGRSPKDTLKLNELKSLLSAAEPDEVHLVLSTTSSQECVEMAIERFADVRADKLIFTKLDEAAHVGVVLNVVTKVKKSLSYITTGQDVAKDIEVGEGRRLARMILGSGL